MPKNSKGCIVMTGNKTVGVNFRMDEDLKLQIEKVFDEMGLTLTAGFTVFAKAVVRSGTIPFDLTVDKFYRAEHQEELTRRIELLESGATKGNQVAKTIEELEELSNA